MSKGIVYIVHHVDTEGPLYESRDELWKRIKITFNIDIDPTEENLKKLQNKEIPLNGIEDEVASLVNPHTLDLKCSWKDIDRMLDHVMSESFKNKILDSKGKGWVYNWHCMDHVGYINNPRKRDLGYFKIFDFYTNKIKETNSVHDRIHWHFHPINFFKDAHICATSYNNCMDILQQIITRRIIERDWFFTVHRAGFAAERN